MGIGGEMKGISQEFDWFVSLELVVRMESCGEC